MPATTTKRKKNPAIAAREEKPFPFLQPEYPVKPWVNSRTGVVFTTVSFRQDNGTFAAFIAEDESVWTEAMSRLEAEEKAKAAYASRIRSSEKQEEAEVRKLIDDRKNLPAIPWREWMKKYA